MEAQESNFKILLVLSWLSLLASLFSGLFRLTWHGTILTLNWLLNIENKELQELESSATILNRETEQPLSSQEKQKFLGNKFQRKKNIMNHNLIKGDGKMNGVIIFKYGLLCQVLLV